MPCRETSSHKQQHLQAHYFLFWSSRVTDNANTLMSEGLIGCSYWHHLQRTCKRLNGLSCASGEEGKKKQGVFLHFHSNYTQWFWRDMITIVILQSYSSCADLQRSELWKRKLPDISYFPGKWLTTYIFICILILWTQLIWRHIAKTYLKCVLLNKYTGNWTLKILFLEVSLTALPIKSS